MRTSITTRRGIGARRAVALRVAQFGVADGVGIGVDAGLPSRDSQRAPSTWLSTATPLARR